MGPRHNNLHIRQGYSRKPGTEYGSEFQEVNHSTRPLWGLSSRAWIAVDRWSGQTRWGSYAIGTRVKLPRPSDLEIPKGPALSKR